MLETQIDPNTGLIDRLSCLQLVEDKVEQANDTEQSLALLWIDLDRFKHLNESFGYDGGDSILSLVSERIREKVNGSYSVGRIGVDEFLVVAPNLEITQAEKLGDELMEAIEPSINMGDFKVRLTASIGIAMLEPEETASELMERADWSKKTAKNQGGNRYVVSGEEILPSHMGIIQAREDLEVEYLLLTALDSDGLHLHYQPIIDFSGRVMSVEALMRCTVNGKNVPPARFFPVAERNGLISRLSEWSLLHGALQAKALSDENLQTQVSINISKGQIADPKFTDALSEAIKLADVDPGLIELEFSESIFMDSSEVIQTNLRTAREIGVGLSIDNFGTGFSCMAKLKDIPASKLKIGRAFTMALVDDKRALSVVKSLITMGKDLGMTMIAEGVETKEQMDTLKELSIDGIQGYYYAKPMDVNTLTSWLREREH